METPDNQPAPEKEDSTTPASPATTSKKPSKSPKKEKKAKEGIGSDRGTQTLFRSAYRVHVNLTTLADSKANFLISVNSLIMFLVAVHGIRFVKHAVMIYPVVIVLLSCTGSIVFAVLSARPRITREQMEHQSQFNGGMNLLFFGHFTRLPKDIFMKELTSALTGPPGSYNLMMNDLYELGQVLNKKFRQLQFSYFFLLYGLPTGMILFLVLEILILTDKI